MTLALVFPGHGSHMTGMLDLISSRPEVKETLQEASDALGMDMGKLISSGSKEEISSLPTSAPAMVTAGVSYYRTWLAEGGQLPSIVAGHSHGEYSALVAAGVISFKDALSIVRYRAESMVSALPAGIGGMAAIIGLGASKVIDICSDISSKTGKIVEAVNFNAPGQVLISGHKEAVAEACKEFELANAKLVIPLAIKVPAHSSLLSSVSDKLREYFKTVEFRAPLIPVVNNVDAVILDRPDDIKDAMARQVSKPVRWQEVIKVMSAKGIEQVVECGPGTVLQELVSRIDNKLQGITFIDEHGNVKVIKGTKC